MLLVIDVGNTNMEFGLYRGAELIGSFRLMTDANRTSDELGLWLCQYFQRFGLELGQVEDVVIGSVAPQVMHTLSRARTSPPSPSTAPPSSSWTSAPPPPWTR